MGGTTSPDSIPYMTATDPLAGLDEYTLSLATRLQAMWNMAQGGQTTMTGVTSNVTVTKRVDFPTAFTSGNPPNVVVCLGELISAANPTHVWAVSIDNTGFTLGYNGATGTRWIRWMAIP